MQAPQQQIEEELTALDRKIEVIAVERFGADSLRIYIDHPDGVDLGLCERVSTQLRGLSSEWALEVSSPGIDRPLTKPEHYRRFLGSRVRVRTSEPIQGRKSFTGELTATTDDAISVEDQSEVHEIPLSAVHRSNLVPEFSEVNQ